MQTKQELERKLAVARYISGEKPKAILASIGRPKKWLYKWVARYRSGDADWFVDDSRTPRTMPTKTPPEMVAQIVAERKTLEKTLYADRGVFAIKERLLDIGITNIPSDPTISRIIRDAGLVKRPSHRDKVGTPYPAPPASEPNDLHEMDVWGPRYLGVGKRCYAVNIIDVARRCPCINPVQNKTHDVLLSCLVRSWRTLGLPRVLQMDNLVLTTHPGCICKMLRLCLHVGIEPLLVPYREPWRQGVVEKFNDFFDKNFFRRHRFADLMDLKERAITFEEHCRHSRRVAALQGKTPQQAFPEVPIRLLPADFAVQVDNLGIAPGRISCIRMIRSNQQIDLLGRKFPVSEDYYREYVKATLFTAEDVIRLYHQDRQIAEHKFSKC